MVQFKKKKERKIDLCCVWMVFFFNGICFETAWFFSTLTLNTTSSLFGSSSSVQREIYKIHVYSFSLMYWYHQHTLRICIIIRSQGRGCGKERFLCAMLCYAMLRKCLCTFERNFTPSPNTSVHLNLLFSLINQTHLVPLLKQKCSLLHNPLLLFVKEFLTPPNTL